MLTPQTVGSTTGNMGLLILSPGEWNAEHIHPFSEEYLIVTQGTLLIRVDGVPHTLRPAARAHRADQRPPSPLE
jgi:putative monooxygenase